MRRHPNIFISAGMRKKDRTLRTLVQNRQGAAFSDLENRTIQLKNRTIQKLAEPNHLTRLFYVLILHSSIKYISLSTHNLFKI